MNEAARHQMLIDDELFGTIIITVDTHHSVVVQGDGIPHARIERTVDSDANEYVPVGTRERSELEATVGGGQAEIHPARGRLSRKSYRVDLTHRGVSYRLNPDSIASSSIQRNGTTVGDLSHENEGIFADWSVSSPPDPTDAAVAYALAAAFGTGAQPAWMTAVDVIAAVIPN